MTRFRREQMRTVPASTIAFTPDAGVVATDVQGAIVELATELALVDTSSYTHIQGSPSAVWVVVHNLGRYPSAVAIIDSGGVQGWGAIVHDSINQLTITFGAPFSGRAEVR